MLLLFFLGLDQLLLFLLFVLLLHLQVYCDLVVSDGDIRLVFIQLLLSRVLLRTLGLITAYLQDELRLLLGMCWLTLLLFGRRSDRHLNLLRIPFEITVHAVPYLDVVDLILAELAQVLGTLRMNPTTIRTLILAGLTRNHEI